MANATSYIYAGSAHVPAQTGGKNLGGLFRRAVGDDHWQALTNGLPEEAEVRAIAVHPQNPQVIYAGTQYGPYRSTDGGDHWEKLGFPDLGMVTWSILFDPKDPQTMYLGTAPAAVYRSDNGGDTWRRLPNAKQPERVQMGFDTRLIRMAADPSNPDEIYAGVEVGGLMRSLDGGETWTDWQRPSRRAGWEAAPEEQNWQRHGERGHAGYPCAHHERGPAWDRLPGCAYGAVPKHRPRRELGGYGGWALFSTDLCAGRAGIAPGSAGDVRLPQSGGAQPRRLTLL